MLMGGGEQTAPTLSLYRVFLPLGKTRGIVLMLNDFERAEKIGSNFRFSVHPNP